MTIFRSEPIIRPAAASDQASLTKFLNLESQVHRHLDWRSPLDWLGKRPFWVVEQVGNIQGVFACPPDPPNIAWIRLFSCKRSLPDDQYFHRLLQVAQAELMECQPQSLIIAIGLQYWFQKILVKNGFSNHQNIVVLEWNGQKPAEVRIPPDMTIRPMLISDLPSVQIIDNAAFEYIWSNSLETLTLAFQQGAYSTVAEDNSGIIGYQISTSIPLSGHLARLAVLPGSQRAYVGYHLVSDMLAYFKKRGMWRVTVNTQDTNLSSLALYEKIGFHRTGEVFPVYSLASGAQTNITA